MSLFYDELVDLVRDWANRDTQALSDSIITSALRYSADEAYRRLEIPPLEFTSYFVLTEDGVAPTFTGGDSSNIGVGTLKKITADGIQDAEIPVPGSLVSFIHIRSSGKATRDGSDNVVLDADGVPVVTHTYSDPVFDQKSDIRTYYDMNHDKVAYNFWSRKQGSILLSGHIAVDDVIEVHYYRRLAALDARVTLPTGLTLAAAQAAPELYEVLTPVEHAALNATSRKTFSVVEGSYVRSVTQVSNWLRDENERVLLFGALHRCFDYLQEEDQSQKYYQRFLTAMDELNQEERRRKASGGNIRVNYSGHGFI